MDTPPSGSEDTLLGSVAPRVLIPPQPTLGPPRRAPEMAAPPAYYLPPQGYGAQLSWEGFHQPHAPPFATYGPVEPHRSLPVQCVWPQATYGHWKLPVSYVAHRPGMMCVEPDARALSGRLAEHGGSVEASKGVLSPRCVADTAVPVVAAGGDGAFVGGARGLPGAPLVPPPPEPLATEQSASVSACRTLQILKQGSPLG